MKLRNRLKKRYHVLRRQMGAGVERPARLVIEKVRWLNDARSPVMLMIDDLTNAWHDPSGSGTWETRGDWGGGLMAPNSAVRFLEERLLRDFPAVRVTWFTVAGPISSYTRDQPFSHAARLDESEQTSQFFRAIGLDPRFELAYHGLNHGTPGGRSDQFVQEWRAFTSVGCAVDQARRGIEVFRRATGVTPRGGKYGGWDYNDFADEAVNDCGFLWWCRDWTPRDVTGRVSDAYYEPQFFGRNLVVALPSAVHGHYWSRRQIDTLLDRQQVIAIAEHIAPIRPDGLIQTPNIVDDIDELRRLFRYLAPHDVWYATGSEIASYVAARELSTLYDISRDGFSISYQGRFEKPSLTLTIDCAAICSRDQPDVQIWGPEGTAISGETRRRDVAGYRHLVTLPVVTGRYEVRPCRLNGGQV